MAENVLLRHEDVPDIHKLDVYLAHDGYVAARKALTTLKPEEVTALVKESNCVGGVGRAFRPASNGDSYPRTRISLSICVATQTRVSLERSKIGRSLRRTPISCWKGFSSPATPSTPTRPISISEGNSPTAQNAWNGPWLRRMTRACLARIFSAPALILRSMSTEELGPISVGREGPV